MFFFLRYNMLHLRSASGKLNGYVMTRYVITWNTRQNEQNPILHLQLHLLSLG